MRNIENKNLQVGPEKIVLCLAGNSAVILSTDHPFSTGRALINKQSSTIRRAIFVI